MDSRGKRTAVIVLGMHRTGTSALSGILHMLGAGGPSRFDDANQYNPKGYWESAAIRAFDDQLLSASGSNWSDWSELRFDSLSSETAERAERLAEVITQEYGESRLFVVKDPRLCRIAPLLMRALENLSVQPRIVIPVRNPLESAQSLYERDRMALEEGLLLWLRHMLDAEKASRGHPRCFVWFDDLLDDWRRVADRLTATLGIEWPTNPAAEETIDAFLSAELRHHRIPLDELKQLHWVPAWVPCVYEIMLELARGGELTPARAEQLDDVRRNFNTATPAFRSIIRARESLAREARDLETAAREQVARLETDLHELSARTHAQAETAREQIAALNTKLQEVSTRAQEQAEVAREQIAILNANLQEVSARAKTETEIARKRLERSAQEAEDYRSRLAASEVSLAAQTQESGRTRSEMQARISVLETENAQSWLDLVRARVALHKALNKDAARKLSVGWPGSAGKQRMSKAEREQRQADLIRVSGLFSSEWYLLHYPDVSQAGIDPVLHYLRHGWAELRDPGPRFSTSAYLRRHLDVASAKANPLVHFLEFGINEARLIEPAGGLPPTATAIAEPAKQEPSGAGVTAEHLKFTRRGPEYEEFDSGILAGVTPDVKVLAFYLPQFHAIPENDRSWGKGFTEWRQVARGLPRFPGHYQPRLPRDLGFYDLTDPDVMRRQIALAKAAGINGFGFYYYWFDSHRVLEQPVETFLTSPDMDMPFMAIWANENWTRTWDGMSGEILLHQNYDPQHEPALLADLARHFKDPRYIRFGNRPFFVIYQPRHVPDPRETFARWRARWKSEFGLEPLIFMAQTFGVEDPSEFGLDGAIEFPPHKLTNNLPGRPVPDAFDPAFKGRVVSYDEVAAISLAEAEPAYPLIKTIAPGWDNDARRPMRGTTLEGSTPRKYGRWLTELVARARAKPTLGERIVAINAWNEWAEGAYLEPDLYYGSAYLNATARALLPHSEVDARRSKNGVVLVGHDALDFGAQRLLLNIGGVLTRQFGVRVRYVLFEGGSLLPRYEAIAPCIILSPMRSAKDVLADLAEQGYTLGISNTTVVGSLVTEMKAAGLRTLSLIHELPHLIRSYGHEESAAAVGRSSDLVVFAGSFVRDSFRQISGEITGRTLIKPQGLYRNEIAPDPAAAGAVRDALGVPRDAKLVLNVGYGDLRKGFDLFIRTAKTVAKHRHDVYFVWVGKVLSKGPDVDSLDGGGRRNNDKVMAVGQQEDVSRYYAAADVFFLSSREDPYPSVVLEAMAAGLPVLGFAGATGCEDLIKAHGTIVPFEDIDAAVGAIEGVLEIPTDRARANAEARIAEIRTNYDFKDYCFWLLQQLSPDLQRVSVVVPNYNHERYLRERLGSIFRQSWPICQIVVLDDASTDNSVAVIRRIATEHRREIALIANETNGGSLAKQWRKGLAQCTGDFVWIAESDDVADPAFLAECVQALERSGADFCFTDSWQIDDDGKRVGDSYIRYVDEIEPGTFTHDFVMAGEEFLRRFLSVKNVILNMSGVLWRREALEQAIKATGEELQSFRIAGDWRLYAAACAAGQSVAYLAKALNGHRRHKQSITSSLQKERHVEEIRQIQMLAAREVKLNEDCRAKAQKHLADVHRYLGLTMAPSAETADVP